MHHRRCSIGSGFQSLLSVNLLSQGVGPQTPKVPLSRIKNGRLCAAVVGVDSPRSERRVAGRPRKHGYWKEFVYKGSSRREGLVEVRESGRAGPAYLLRCG
jgi:hypothetical protein